MKKQVKVTFIWPRDPEIVEAPIDVQNDDTPLDDGTAEFSVGPFDFAQVTYDCLLRVGKDGKDDIQLARVGGHWFWGVLPPFIPKRAKTKYFSDWVVEAC